MGYFSYHRVSSKNQKEDRGVDEINKYCEEHNITLDRPIFIDKQSGKNFDRPRRFRKPGQVLRIRPC
jgi:DNA invertase Pin-like site-specific DNA recombinase